MAKKTKTTKTPRTRKVPAYKSFRLSKKIKPAASKPLPGIIGLCKIALIPWKTNRRLFLGIIAIHFLLTIILASGIGSSIDFVNLKNNLEETFGGEIDTVTSVTALFSYVLTTNSSDGSSSNYQLFVTLIMSLATIWAIRQTLAGEKVGVKQAFYQGVYPLVPFLMVVFVIGLQLIPLLIGNFLLATVLGNGLAVTGAEQVLWWLIFGLFALLSLYLVLSSIFALYISTLPDMTPMRALRSARGLVMHRRLSVALRLVGLPFAMFVVYALVLIPLIFVVPILVVPVFFALGSFSLFFVHSYLYNLYRALL